jgi:hypothetical protein
VTGGSTSRAVSHAKRSEKNWLMKTETRRSGGGKAKNEEKQREDPGGEQRANWQIEQVAMRDPRLHFAC